MPASPLALAAAKLKTSGKTVRKLRLLPLYESTHAALEAIGLGPSMAYLQAVIHGLLCNDTFDKPFHRHRLTAPPLKGYESIIVGEIDETDITFVLIFRIVGAELELHYIEQHDDAYATLAEVKR